MNGLDYDHWAERSIDALDDEPAVIDAGAVVGREEGDNPHIWYGPEFVRDVCDAVAAELQQLAPDASSYLEARHLAWLADLQPYDEAVASVRAVAGGKSVAMTEPVFDDMAEAVGLTNATPEAYRNAAMNESEPPPAAIAAFEDALESGEVAVLIDNTQTEAPIPVRLREIAEDAGVPVVEVSETLPPGVDSFVEWQVDQLEALLTALTP
jgi:zinc/manganese transport system substrate-binding protein